MMALKTAIDQFNLPKPEVPKVNEIVRDTPKAKKTILIGALCFFAVIILLGIGLALGSALTSVRDDITQAQHQADAQSNESETISSNASTESITSTATEKFDDPTPTIEAQLPTDNLTVEVPPTTTIEPEPTQTPIPTEPATNVEVPPDGLSLKQIYIDSLEYAYEKEYALAYAESFASLHLAVEAAHDAWDDEINRIYGMIREKLPSGEMDALRTSQLAWIRYRDNEAEKTSREQDIDELKDTAILAKKMDLTKTRTLELIDYYFDGTLPTRYS
jgi:uncharacterized protein YecT (DUF1311 family)